MNLKTIIKNFVLVGIIIPLWNCNTNNPTGQIPVLKTVSVSNITPSTATCGGIITNDGGAAITARGVCWSTGITQTISDNKTIDGTGLGSFTSNLTGLKGNTFYFVRAYATNSTGTGYGSAMAFTTSLPLPILTTNAVTNITSTTATCGGNITSDGGGTITARGICWSMGNTPTINDYKTSDGIGVGSYTSQMTGLIPSTTYYVRAYATNGAGTSYGDVAQFKTHGEIITDIDGNVYHTVKIGDQVWMVENLKTTRYRNGEALPNLTDTSAWNNSKTGAYCNYDNNSWYDATAYGRLYNCYAVKDKRNIAPNGWHVPSDVEWTKLITYLSGGDGAGGKLKEAETVNWQDPNTGATNESGFTALPGGYRGEKGEFFDVGYYGFWWTTTSPPPPLIGIYGRYMGYNFAVVERGCYPLSYGFSIRCLKDE